VGLGVRSVVSYERAVFEGLRICGNVTWWLVSFAGLHDF
jgi:hypothetical protein